MASLRMARAKVVAQPPHQKEPQRKPMCDDDDVILAGRISAGAHERSRTRHIGQIFRYAGPGNTASVRTSSHSVGQCSLLVGRRWQTYHETVSTTRRGRLVIHLHTGKKKLYYYMRYMQHSRGHHQLIVCRAFQPVFTCTD